MSRLHLLLVASLSVFSLTACQSTSEPDFSVSSNHAQYFQDQTFDLSFQQQVETKADIFKLDPEIIDTVRGQFELGQRAQIRIEAFMQQVLGKPNVDILYQAHADLTASQAYRNKTANCLSLSIMAYALAQQAKLDVEFQEVKVPELWTMRNGNRLANGHVNVRILAKDYLHDGRHITYERTLDFAPEIAAQKFRAKRISKPRVQALFYNNKAAQAIIDENYDLAYAYIKAALNLYNADSPTWSNLGLIYKRKGLYELAENTFLKAASLDQKNYTPLDNLVGLYQKTGRDQEAEDLKAELEYKRKKNPFYHALKGDIAYKEGNMELAIKSYKKAIKLDSSPDEFYFGIAKAYFELGDNELALKYLNKAKLKTDFNDVARRYQRKINALQNLHAYQF
ncbi:tetratricopeptide repeat protein [Catenovulum sp. SM1970]|uniref:tetratricopeptide repeat protein n=1 Tax=Marinifaba aquimaris TaxID=2741323 RepID=UPI0015718C20|nr:tetratricopeptide repeat protein [Marinifaba aquimaris]NTS76601.1 tetratricopeptide repeat protein [Marinifaba aquimaris]